MVTKAAPEPEESEPGALDQMEAIGRTVIAGSPVGAVRRILLYLAVWVSLLLALVFGEWGVVTGGAALVLLMATDDLR
jgi:hypothetical protein